MPESIVEMDGSARSQRAEGARFAQAKFRPPEPPATLVTRPALQDRLTVRGSQRLTVVVGSAGVGKSVLLSSWAAARPPGMTSWLSCDEADADPVRFWTAFIEALRVVAPEFGADAADMLARDNAMSADVTASIANDAATLLPPGAALIVDDFGTASASVATDMTDLVERWPVRIAQLVLASRSDPPLRLHRLRITGQLGEIRDRDLCFSLAESRDLLAKFGVDVGAKELALLHQRSEGWVAALQMAALSLRESRDPARVIDMHSQALGEYFIAEVLDQQPPDVAEFMLETSILSELTTDACAAITQRQDAAALFHSINAPSLFLVALDDEQTSFRYHHLVRRVLRAELRARDRVREGKLQLLAAEWFESAGDMRRAARHLLAARQADRALALIQDRVVPEFLRDPALPAAPDLSTVDPSLLADAPDRLLALAAELLQSGDIARGGEYLDLLDRAEQPIPPESKLAARFAGMRAFRHAQIGHLGQAVDAAQAARAIQERTQLADEWNPVVPLVLLSVYPCLEDFTAVEREAAAAQAMPELTEPARLLLVPGARALAWFQAGHLTEAASTARAAETDAERLGFSQHFFAVDYLRVRAGLALERQALHTAEQLTEQVLRITERRRPLLEFLALLDRAGIWAARGQARDALTTVVAARQVLPGASPMLLAQANELEALLRLSLGDVRAAAKLAGGLPASRRGLLLARIALATGDHHTAHTHLHALSPGELTPRRALVHRLLLAAAAIERGDPAAADVLASALHNARQGGFLNTVVSTAPQVTRYLVEHLTQTGPDPFVKRLVGAARQTPAAQSAPDRSSHCFAPPLTAAEIRILKLLPTRSYQQMADTLYVSHNTVKSHLRSVYRKLGVATRAQAIERAVELSLLRTCPPGGPIPRQGPGEPEQVAEGRGLAGTLSGGRRPAGPA